MKKKAFTLIELIAVLVILAILALIVTPLVMNIIRKARVSADKRSIDAYGRSVELAIANYLLDNGDFPTSIDQLTIEYLGDEVVCSTTQLNSDSSVYLAGCTVSGRSVDYTYGKSGTTPTPTGDAYEVGDEVTYNGVDYYVIKDSSASDATVTLLKAEPLTVDEVNLYGGVGTENNHVNIKPYSGYNTVGTAFNINGYGGMAYYSSDDCYTVGHASYETGCKVAYDLSDIKYVVDAWKIAEAPLALSARLINKEEIETEIREYDPCGGCGSVATGEFAKNDWVYNSSYSYWTMSPMDGSTSSVRYVYDDGGLGDSPVYSQGVVRPVITISKSALN